MHADVTDEAEVAAAVDAAVEMAPLRVLVNCAGIGPPQRTVTRDGSPHDLRRFEAVIKVNLIGTFNCIRLAAAAMAGTEPLTDGSRGAIVNTASTWGLYPGPGHLAYCTSKGAVAALTKNLGRDHAPDNIRINAVCPNEVNTPMLRTGFAKRGFDPDKAVEQLNKTVPLGRIAEPEEIADVIAFLASDDARYIAGATVEVTGAKPVY